MAGPAHTSDRTLAEARHALVRQRGAGAGGGRSIGRRSAALKARHRVRKLARITVAVFAILVAALVAGLVIDGIGFTGIVVTVLAIIAAIFVFGRYPRMRTPSRTDLAAGDVRTMVGRTELWLEAQRPALPAPAVQVIDRIGGQLDTLGVQLDGLDRNEPAAAEVRRLVGEHLPEMVDSYRRIPAHLRREPRAGRTPDEQLAEGLGKISDEIEAVTRQLAAGDLDALAVRGRYLDYKYGGALEDGTARPQES